MQTSLCKHIILRDNESLQFMLHSGLLSKAKILSKDSCYIKDKICVMCIISVHFIFKLIIFCVLFYFPSLRSQLALRGKGVVVWPERWLCPGWFCPACRLWPPRVVSHLHHPLPRPLQAARSTDGRFPPRRATHPTPTVHASQNTCRWVFVCKIKTLANNVFVSFLFFRLKCPLLIYLMYFWSSLQAASTLKQHESLRHCKRCGSPATHLAEAQRATCKRSSCLFDFCTRCQEPFHGSTPCRTVQPRHHFTTSRTTPILPGSARSKRNVRRLWQKFTEVLLAVLIGLDFYAQAAFPLSQTAEKVSERTLNGIVDAIQRHLQELQLNQTESNGWSTCLKHYWDNQPESVIWQNLLSFVSDKQIWCQKKKRK